MLMAYVVGLDRPCEGKCSVVSLEQLLMQANRAPSRMPGKQALAVEWKEVLPWKHSQVVQVLLSRQILSRVDEQFRILPQAIDRAGEALEELRIGELRDSGIIAEHMADQVPRAQGVSPAGTDQERKQALLVSRPFIDWG